MTTTNDIPAGLTLEHILSRFRDHAARHRHKAAAVESASAAVPTEAEELDHLRTALGAAVTLEFATLPPYLSAIWCIKDELHPIAKSLREILQEEMLHMALVCNMLVAIGGTPQINTAAPAYPGKLPLEVHPELTVPLAGFSPKVLQVFMEIERPLHPGHHISLSAARRIAKDDPTPADGDLTIGEMYDHVLQTFQRVKPPLSMDRQITGPLAWMVVTNLDEVEKAIQTIQHQGEGSSGPIDTDAKDLAHYYRFAEMLELKELEQNEHGGFTFKKPIDFDFDTGVWHMAPVPEGGYTDADVADPETRRLLRGFNLTYSKLLDLLQAAWSERGGQAMFWHAIETMFGLEKFAKPLLRIPRPDGAGNYGPDFRYIPLNER